MPDVTVSGHRFKLSKRLIIGGIIAVLALILILQNTQDVQVHVLFWHADRPLWLWFFLLFAGGFIVGTLFPWARLRERGQPAKTPTTSTTTPPSSQ
jgi:uncharacterized integral membrane protein